MVEKKQRKKEKRWIYAREGPWVSLTETWWVHPQELNPCPNYGFYTLASSPVLKNLDKKKNQFATTYDSEIPGFLGDCFLSKEVTRQTDGLVI